MKRRSLRLPRPTPALGVSVVALVVALGGTSYAAMTIGSQDLKDDSVRSIDIKDGTLKDRDFRTGTLMRGPQGEQGPQGPQGEQGPAGVDRWVLINAAGEIEAQSGGFTVAAAYPTLPNTAPVGSPSNELRANGNVYINAGEDLSNNGIVTSIALQNATDQNGDMIMNGRAPGADANPEFSGEISTTVCGLAGIVTCAPTGTNNTSHFVVSPRNSDGTVTVDGARKRFYVIITGDSSDVVAPTP